MVFNHLIGVRFPVGPPVFNMKFLRVGKINQEKPAIIDNNEVIRDISSLIDDLNPKSINSSTIKKINETNL